MADILLRPETPSGTGLPGPPGETGPPGEMGEDGIIGATGAIGPAGAAGAQGPAGLSGMFSLDGEDGEDGMVGPIGLQGPSGLRRVYRSPVAGVNANNIAVATNTAFNAGNPSKITVRMWFRAGQTQNNNGLATRSSRLSAQGDWAFGFFNGTTLAPTFRVNNNGGSVQSTTVLTVGLWYFLEASFDSSLASNNLKIFINGVLDAQATYTTAITNNATPICVGTYFDNQHGILGYIAEFEFCAAIVRNTTNYTPPIIIIPDANTTICWNMNEDIGQATDTSGNGFHGTPLVLTYLDTAFRVLP